MCPGRHRAAGQPAHGRGRRGRRRSQPGTAARIFTGAPVPAGRRRGGHAGALRGRSTARCAFDVVPEPGHRDPPPRRGRARRAAVVLPAGSLLTPQALGLAASVGAADAGGDASPAGGAVLHRRRTRDAGRAAARPAPSTTPTASRCAALIQALGCECTDLGIVPDRLDATRDALRRGGARPRPDRHQRRRLGGRGGSPAPGRAGRRAARPLADRHQARQAAGFRQRAAQRRRRQPGSSACRATRCRASSPSCWPCGRCCCRLQGADAPPAGAAEDARRLRLARPTAAASSCACAATPTAGSTWFAQPGLRAC